MASQEVTKERAPESLVGIEKRRAEPGPITKERVPESYIERIKERPLRKIPPLLIDDEDDPFAENPMIRESIQAGFDRINYLVDVQQDLLRQHAEKGYAEVTGGLKQIFIVPN